jgi:CheY-like chemotaxis protein
MNADKACILHVEDDEDEIILQRVAFKAAGVFNPVHVASDGQQAINYLSLAIRDVHLPAYPLPCLVLLDHNLPFKSGLDVLHWIRQQPQLRDLSIIMLTSCEDPAHIRRAYELGANSFVVKPLDQHNRIEMVRALQKWWFGFNLSPEPFDFDVEEQAMGTALSR